MKLNELPAAVKQKLFNEWEPFLEYKWWDNVYDQYKEDGKERGMYIEDIYFCEFASQGDGACWKGDFFLDGYLAWEEAQETCVFDDRETILLRTALDMEFIYGRRTVKTRGNYSHSGTMEVSEIEIDGHPYADDAEISSGPLAGMQVEKFVTQLEEALPEIDKKITTICRDFADEIYKSLEKEGEYLRLMEAFENNMQDVEFNEEGEEV